MLLSEDAKFVIQCFVYYLFKGTIAPELITSEPNYVQSLLREPQQLEYTFHLLANALRQDEGSAYSVAVEYLVAKYALHDHVRVEALLVSLHQTVFDDVYARFFQLACHFIYNTFDDPIQNPDYLLWLEGNGTDAVPTFATWTYEINRPFTDKVEAFSRALKRANERARRQFDDYAPAVWFTDDELEQDIY
ncbi:hypothetical protein KBK19_10660 [Microvirga sp. STR05]|uniref:DUF7677 domain-containing protein n=1 Tax=Hymenobacter duratus TaxID=2771356 RepID=A0ABR8JHD3_9BACT|nr:hypothetical protein [Hymenobacter duratus]MBD2715497.1 hypothetical protein [Hymenobacter duratus]MBR7950405.1 hypothetical protein [Microvirga sp. STR05]